MKAFILKNSDMMGFTINEQYFLKQEKAIERFNEKIEEYRKDKNLASNEDASEHNMSSEAIKIDNLTGHIKNAMVCLWQRCSYEYDEWDITVEHLELDEIEIQE